MLPPGALGWQVPLWHLGWPGSWALPLWWRVVEGRLGARVGAPLPCLGFVTFVSCKWGARGWSCGCYCVWRDGPCYHCCLVPCGHGCCFGMEAGVTCTTFPAAARFFGSSGSATTARGWDHRHHLPCSPISTSSVCSSTHPPSDIRTCGSLWCPGVLDRGNFVELCMFY